MYLHLPSICLLRPLSVPRTLPHPLQIRFQRRHTPRGEKPREQWGFRADTQVGWPVTASSDCHSVAFPQHLRSSTIWYRSTKSKLVSLLGGKSVTPLSTSLLEFSRSTRSNRLRTTTVEMAMGPPS